MLGSFVNFVAFQIGWFCSVIGASQGWSFLGPIVVAAVVALHLIRFPEPYREMRFLFTVALLGTAVDSLFAVSGLVVYRGGYGNHWIAPAWITAMWLNFGTTIHVSLSWLGKRTTWAAVLGAVGGPLTYRAAAHLGAADLTTPLWSLATVGMAWAAVLPFLFWIAKK